MELPGVPHPRRPRRDRRSAGKLAGLLAHDPALGVFKGTLTPPNLSAVGDKLRPDYLTEAVQGAAPTARPWLSVRMPAISFERGEAEALAAYFQGRDRMEADPTDAPREEPTRPDSAAFEAAVALIGQRGFGCISCHVLAGKIPPGGEPETLGPDLALAHRRMTERYFDRWIGNPQRVIPGTPMPQFLQPVATVPGPLDQQLSTLWQLLGSTRVAEAAAQGTREILKRQGDRAANVRDMVLLPGAPETEYTPRGVAIGLKNGRHSLLSSLTPAGSLTMAGHLRHRGFTPSRTKSGRRSGNGTPKGIASGSPRAGSLRSSSSTRRTRSPSPKRSATVSATSPRLPRFRRPRTSGWPTT